MMTRRRRLMWVILINAGLVLLILALLAAIWMPVMVGPRPNPAGR
jgi:hypothetical protein